MKIPTQVFQSLVLVLFAASASACSALTGVGPTSPPTAAPDFVWPTLIPTASPMPPTPVPTFYPAPALPTPEASTGVTNTGMSVGAGGGGGAPTRSGARQLPEICTATTARQGKVLRGSSQGQTTILFHPAGRYIATFTTNAGMGTVALWSPTGEKLRSRTGSYGAIAMSPEGRVFALGGADKMITIWGLDTWTEERRMAGYKDTVTSIAFSQDAKSVLAGDAGGALRLWSMANGNPLLDFKGGAVGTRALAFSPNSQTFVNGGPSAPTFLWQVSTGKQLKQAERSSYNAVAYNPDGSQIAGGNTLAQVTLWDTNLKEVNKFDLGTGAQVNVVAFSPDGRWLAAGGQESNPRGRTTLRVWEVNSGREKFSTGYATAVTSVAFSPDCKMLAAGDTSGSVQFWDLK